MYDMDFGLLYILYFVYKLFKFPVNDLHELLNHSRDDIKSLLLILKSLCESERGVQHYTHILKEPSIGRTWIILFYII